MSAATARRYSTGLSLIELMVAIVIGIFSSVVLSNIAIFSERSRRTTTSGADAQTVGHMAVFQLATEIRQAGFGLTASSTVAWGCNIPAAGLIGTAFTFAPVVINPGAVAGAMRLSDELVIAYTGTERAPTGARMLAVAGANVTTGSPYNLATNDYVLVAPPSPAACDVRRVLATNAAGVTALDAGSAALVTDSILFSLGAGVAFATRYSVANDQLVSRPVLSGGVDTTLAGGVVGLHAQYGMDGANGGAIDGRIADNEWIDAPSPLPGGWDWNRVRALRVALLTRSAQFEKPEGGVSVTSARPQASWSAYPFRVGDLNAPASDSFASGNADPNNWRNYRYRVLETTIALNNVMWRNAP